MSTKANNDTSTIVRLVQRIPKPRKSSESSPSPRSSPSRPRSGTRRSARSRVVGAPGLRPRPRSGYPTRAPHRRRGWSKAPSLPGEVLDPGLKLQKQSARSRGSPLFGGLGPETVELLRVTKSTCKSTASSSGILSRPFFSCHVTSSCDKQ